MMQAGKYYVGDLCYVMHDVWDEVVDLMYPGGMRSDGEFELKDGRKFAIYSTQWGDGQYPASNGDSVVVDSGTIGCILADDIRDDQYDAETLKDLATYEEFNRPFTTYGYGNGQIAFGLLTIDTDPYESDYDEE